MPTLTSDDFAALEGYMAQMEHCQRAGEHVGFRAPHRAFQQLLVPAMGLRVSTEIRQFTDHAERYRLKFGASGA